MTAPLLLIVIMALVTSSLSSDILQSQIKSSFLKSHVLSTMKQQIKTNQNNNQRLLLDVSPYKWFQEIYYSSSDCSGQPYRMYEFVLGTCFKDSPKTSFLVNLISDADQLDYYEFSDDKCEKVANSSSTDFQGSKFEDVDTQDPTVSCEVLTDEKNNEVLSLRTVYFDTPYNPIYPFSGQIDRAYDFTSSTCKEKFVSGSWRNENACISRNMAQIDGDPAYKDVKSVKFACTNNGGFLDVWGYSDENCQQRTISHKHGNGKYTPECRAEYLPLNDFTPAPTSAEYTNSFRIGSCYTGASGNPTIKPVSSVQPSTSLPSTSAVSSGPDELTPGGNSGSDGSGSDGFPFLMDSLSTELLIIVVISGIAFCLCTGTLVFFLCLRLQSQDTLNRDLMQSFAQLVDRNSRALRSVQEKFSNKIRRNQQVSKARETELSVQESRSLLNDSTPTRKGRNKGANNSISSSVHGSVNSDTNGQNSSRRDCNSRKERDQEQGRGRHEYDDDDDDYNDDEYDEGDDDEVF